MDSIFCFFSSAALPIKILALSLKYCSCSPRLLILSLSSWFSEIKKLSNKEYIAQIKSITEESFLLDKSQIKYTIITKSGGFQKNGCKSN